MHSQADVRVRRTNLVRLADSARQGREDADGSTPGLLNCGDLTVGENNDISDSEEATEQEQTRMWDKGVPKAAAGT